MPRPGFLTKGRANRKITTPGGRTVVHRRNFYRSSGTCALSGVTMQLPKNAKNSLSYKSSKSSKRPNRPYGGYATATAVRRGVIRAARDL